MERPHVNPAGPESTVPVTERAWEHVGSLPHGHPSPPDQQPGVAFSLGAGISQNPPQGTSRAAPAEPLPRAKASLPGLFLPAASGPKVRPDARKAWFRATNLTTTTGQVGTHLLQKKQISQDTLGRSRKHAEEHSRKEKRGERGTPWTALCKAIQNRLRGRTGRPQGLPLSGCSPGLCYCQERSI